MQWRDSKRGGHKYDFVLYDFLYDIICTILFKMFRKHDFSNFCLPRNYSIFAIKYDFVNPDIQWKLKKFNIGVKEKWLFAPTTLFSLTSIFKFHLKMNIEVNEKIEVRENSDFSLTPIFFKPNLT